MADRTEQIRSICSAVPFFYWVAIAAPVHVHLSGDTMRDPKRIDRVLGQIKEAWMKVPDWRLGQLLLNAVEPRDPCIDLFSIEDDRLEHLVSRLSEGKTITRHAFNVADTFDIQDRGLVVTTDKRYKDLPPWLALKIGDNIELRSEGSTVRTKVAGIEFVDPWTPKTPFGFLLPTDMPKHQVTIGCEIWVTESSVVKPVDEN